MFNVKQLEINGNVHNWIKNWLSNGKQRVVINGAPQGSVLGPIDVGINNFISKFPDDTIIRNSIIDDSDRLSLQEDMRKI